MKIFLIPSSHSISFFHHRSPFLFFFASKTHLFHESVKRCTAHGNKYFVISFFMSIRILTWVVHSFHEDKNHELFLVIYVKINTILVTEHYATVFQRICLIRRLCQFVTLIYIYIYIDRYICTYRMRSLSATCSTLFSVRVTGACRYSVTKLNTCSCLANRMPVNITM
jgi:hypothetical protein